jgi:crossover junction endodeoxyribonuclease RusA
MEFSLVLPMPPSANRYWRNYRGVTVVSDEAKAYKCAAGYSAKQQGARVLSGSVSIVIDVFRGRRSGDLDNRLKVALDALKGIAYHDDSQVVEIHARRFDDKGNARIEVSVKELP